MNYDENNHLGGEYSNNFYEEEISETVAQDAAQQQTEAADETQTANQRENSLSEHMDTHAPDDEQAVNSSDVNFVMMPKQEVPPDEVPSSPYSVNYNFSSEKQTESFSQNAYKGTNTTNKVPNKRKSFPALFGSAILFGIVAAVFFQGVNEGAKLLGLPSSGSSQAPIATVAPIEQNTDKKSHAVITKEDLDKDQAKSVIDGIDVSALVERTMPSIVSITSTIEGQGGYYFFGQYYENSNSTGCGSGFIANQDGNSLLIVTNNHVIADADSISVQFIDEEIVSATVQGTNKAADLAVLSVKLSDIKESTKKVIRVAALGNSENCKVGEMAVAIGNALGYGQSVTVGYISAKDRKVSISSESGSGSSTMTLLQTDAAINPGNSGGPLMNLNGEVVGINSVKYASSEVEGMGFAIPISNALPIINQLISHEDIKDSEKGYLGIVGKDVTEEATDFNMPEGVYVDQVSEDGAAKEAGIQVGDIITRCNDITVTSIQGLQELISSYRVGTKITLVVMRGNNGTYKEKTFTVKLKASKTLDSLDLDKGSSSENDTDDRSSNGSDDDDYYNPFEDFGFGW